MIQRFFVFIDWLKWIHNGKPHKKYAGFHCGCCGKWTKKKFKIPTYQSKGEWCDTWGLCDNCEKGSVELPSNGPAKPAERIKWGDNYD